MKEKSEILILMDKHSRERTEETWAGFALTSVAKDMPQLLFSALNCTHCSVV